MGSVDIGDILFMGAMFIPGIILCGIMGILYYSSKKEQRKYLALVNYGCRGYATITALYEEYRKGDIPAAIPHARYSFEVYGETYKGDFTQHKKHFYEKGDKIEVFYDPRDPSKNCTQRNIDDSNFHVRMFTISLILMALLSVGIVIMGWMTIH